MTATIGLSSPLVSAHPSGTSVSTVAGFMPALVVADKSGHVLGAIPSTHFNVEASPSRAINASGSMTIALPRLVDGSPNPYLPLIFDDRIVYLGTELGTPAWAGTIEPQRFTTGQARVEIPDLTALWDGPTLTIADTLGGTIPAWIAYQMAMEASNAQKTLDGEMVWELDLQGTNPFRGELSFEGSAFDIFSAIAQRTGTEFAWSVAVEGDQIVPTLMVRDAFVGATGVTITDVGAAANLAASPEYSRDPTTVISSLTLRGQATDLSRHIADCFDWAFTDVQPSVTVTVDPGVHRRRKTAEVNVDWGLSDTDQASLANGVLAVVNALYLTFLYAFHEEEGRPYHDGWQYEGPPGNIEEFLHTGLGWRTRSAFITYQDQPASAAMYSLSSSQLLIVRYDRVTEVKTVQRVWFTEAGILYVLKWYIHGFSYFYEVAGGVITGRRLLSFDHSSGTVSKDAVTLMWPGEGAGTDHPWTTYHTLRRASSISETEDTTEGHYVDPNYVTGPTTGFQFTRPTIGDPPYSTLVLVPAPDTVDFEPVVTAWDFELRRICDWDPRRDGVGALTNKRIVVNNQPATPTRWHRVPWGTGGDGSTSLTHGISATETMIQIDNAFVLPTVYPYDAIIGAWPGEEQVQVTSGLGTILTVARGQNSTAAIIHETGEQFQVTNAAAWTGFVNTSPPWPEGEAYAQDLLSRMNRAQERLSLQLTNENDDWITVNLGSLHPVVIATEGPEGGYTGTVRVIGFSPNPATGTQELVVEPWP